MYTVWVSILAEIIRSRGRVDSETYNVQKSLDALHQQN